MRSPAILQSRRCRTNEGVKLVYCTLIQSAWLYQTYSVSCAQPCRLWYVEPVVQLRRYSPYLVAEVTVESDSLRDALSSGFKQVQHISHDQLLVCVQSSHSQLCVGGRLHLR